MMMVDGNENIPNAHLSDQILVLILYKILAMKRAFTSVLLVVTSGVAIAQPVSWETPITVSSGGTYGNLHPRVVLNRAGDPMVLWGKTDTKAYFSRWNGTAFTTPIAVGNSGINVFAQSWAGPDIASFGDTVYVTMKRTPETMAMNHMYVSRSTDGGMTFSDTMRIDNFDTSLSRFPIVTTTSTGQPLVAFMKFNTSFGDAQYVVSRSTDLGSTFSADVLASGTAGDVCDCCPAFITSSGSRAIMLFRNDLSNIRDIWASVSNDGGMTFPGTMNVDNNAWMIMSCPSSGPDGFIIGDSLYSVFRSSAGGTAKVYLSRASISGMTSATSAITGAVTGLLSQDYPRVANYYNATIIVWVQNTSSGRYLAYTLATDITAGFPAYSTVTGATGSGIVNGDVAIREGVVHAVWEDDNTGKVMYAKGQYSTLIGGVSSVVAGKLNVYPVPASRQLCISLEGLNGVSSCYVADNMGRKHAVSPELRGNTAFLSLHGLAKGGYYIVLEDNAGRRYYSRFVVE